MACPLAGAKPLSEPMMEYCQSYPLEQNLVKYNQHSYIFIHENVFEYVVCEMSAILSQPQYVNFILDWVIWQPYGWNQTSIKQKTTLKI